MIDYRCENGAYHTYNCCPTCWNRHPAHIEGKDFRVDQRQVLEEVLMQAAIESAMGAGFTESQARWLVNTEWGRP